MQNFNDLFVRQEIADFKENIFKLIGEEWMLITAGDSVKFNTMTASWGTLGVFWNKPIAVCFIRPTRFTFEFSEKAEIITMSFFEEQHKEKLLFCGKNSGRDTDKIITTGLTPISTPLGGIGYEQSKLIIETKKIYFDDIKPNNFLLPDIDKTIYPQKDYHRMYFGEIMGIYNNKL